MKKHFQLRSFDLCTGDSMERDLLRINNYLKDHEVSQVISVSDGRYGVILLLEPVKANAQKTGDAGESEPSSEQTALSAEQVRTIERLKAWRSAKAAEIQAPVFMILPNQAIHSIAAEMPETLTQLTACKGMGPVRAQKYGKELLEALHGVPA